MNGHVGDVEKNPVICMSELEINNICSFLCFLYDENEKTNTILYI